ncbi:MAG: hypothetical protein ACI4JB_05035 [Porcipelethomonas sp.]
MNNNNPFESEDMTGSFDTNDIEQNKVLAAVGYIPVLFLVPLLAAPQSQYAKFHANQGLILTIASIALGIARSVLCAIFGIMPLFKEFVPTIISAVVSVAILAYMVIGIITASQGKAKKLPIIGGFLNIIH